MKNIEIIKTISVDVYNYIKKKKFLSIPDGKYQINNDIYVNIESYVTQPRCKRKFEAHRKYIDIQYVIEGEEVISIISTELLGMSNGYDDCKDIEFFCKNNIGDNYYLSSNDFLIIYPGQAHMPCISINEDKKVRKAVFKIPVKK